MRVIPWLLLASPALAQLPPGVELPVEGTIKGRKAVAAEIRADVAEVRAGPGAAYVSRGRAYRGDAATASRRNEAGDWVEVAVGGLRGWVRVTDLRFGGDGVRRDADGEVDAGRDRRETNYRYDERGRRLRADGTPMGSGEGTEGDDDAAPPDDRPAAPAAPHLRVAVAIGAAQLGRDFKSDIDAASPLDVLTASPTGLATTLQVDWSPRPWLGVRGLFRDSRLGSITLAAQPDAGFAAALELAVEAQQVEVDAQAGVPLGPAWLGGYAGARVLRHAYQQSAPFPVFLTDTYLGLGAGARAAATLGPLDAAVEGGVVLPLSVSQSPVAGGTADAIGAEVRLDLAVALSPTLAVFAQGYWSEITADFEGESTHRDTVIDQGYTTARSVDQVIGGGAGVRYTVF
ncbi:MAG: hypothetical protein H6706_11975 [Myxococcales bacterium]|nr:hypothetical protein [Myxococcales bacterium]